MIDQQRRFHCTCEAGRLQQERPWLRWTNHQSAGPREKRLPQSTGFARLPGLRRARLALQALFPIWNTAWKGTDWNHPRRLPFFQKNFRRRFGFMRIKQEQARMVSGSQSGGECDAIFIRQIACQEDNLLTVDRCRGGPMRNLL